MGSSVADNFRAEQEQCAELDLAWKHAKEGKGKYYEEDGYLFHKDKILGESIGQLVIPECRRNEVLKLAHTSVFSSHMGPKKTLERITYSFFWKGMRTDVKKYCDSCNECQLNQTVKVVNIDLIGPIDPPRSKENKYILCLVDQHTRWGEAVPLNSLSAKRDSTLDYGSVSISIVVWQATTRPLSILKSTWIGKSNNIQLNTAPVSKYLEDLKSKFEVAAEQAKLVSAVQQENTAYYHNLRSSNKVFKVRDQVIVLIPNSTNKLFAGWQGPATIAEKRNPHSFLVKLPDGSTKHIHQNKLKKYITNSNADQDKICAIQKLSRPITEKEVRWVLGLMGFYRTYISNYAELSTPLTELTKKNKPNNVSWGEAEQKSFDRPKELLCEVTSLATPDANLPF
ncbi:hypothetical protein AVEN_99713-1 [Araneus ventricosus]|uniref:RNA-directed DNA polymerase n=1 Tax=Araneus ventricosus TaxID=182803 RepID=A0A4Y2QNB3_ARAVE|nr:hypothetical protein AVEN_99713-1 [Araneus ventricosus]